MVAAIHGLRSRKAMGKSLRRTVFRSDDLTNWPAKAVVLPGVELWHE